jgi:hypothetical protein
MFLLGAGASVEAGIPASVPLTKAIVERINRKSTPIDHIAPALNFVCGALTAYDASKGENPYTGLDVERVFAAVELLARRKDLEVTPFVSAWHPSVDEWDRENIDELMAWTTEAVRDPKKLEALLDGIVGIVLGGGDGEIYRSLMQEMVQELVGLLAAADGSLDYLRPLVALGDTPGGLTIASLNYDLTIERIAGLMHVPVATGIEQMATGTRIPRPDHGIQLLKLHGSIDWEWHREEWKEGEIGRSTVVPVDPTTRPEHEPVLVFGHGSKLKAEGPFLMLLAELEARLQASDELVVVGYSFRDDHINELLRRWMVAREDSVLTVIDPSFPEWSSWGWHKPDFRTKLLIALKPTDRLRVLREQASVGLARYTEEQGDAWESAPRSAN